MLTLPEASQSFPCGRGRPSAISTSSHLESLYGPGQAPQPGTLPYLGEIVEPEQDNIVQDFVKDVQFYAIIGASAFVCTVWLIYSHLNLYEDVLSFQLCPTVLTLSRAP